MAEEKNLRPTDDLSFKSENLRVKYNALEAYINTVVTFRFTTLGFYLAVVALILGGTPSFGKYLLLDFITIPLYIIELRNRFLKNDLGARAKLIENEWISNNRTAHYAPVPTYIFGKQIPYRDDDYIKSGISHGWAFDILYFSIFFYALIHILILRVSFILFSIHSLLRIFH